MKLNHNKIALGILAALTIAFAAVLFTAPAKAETLEDRVAKLEKNVPNLPNGFFINGEVEGYYDDKTYDSGWDSRAELQVGISTDLPKNSLNIGWAGASMVYDTHYSLNTSLNNTVQEKQIGLGNDTARIYFGETDAQRMGLSLIHI